MNIGQLLINLSDSEKKVIRKIEKINYKINGAEVAKIFNETCIREGLLPVNNNNNNNFSTFP